MLIIISIFYLYPKETIKNWDGLFVFIPLLLLGISTETMSRNKKLNAKKLKPYSLLDFLVKIGAFIFAECIYRKLVGTVFICCFFGLLIIAFVCSIILDVKMLLIVKNDEK